ncbi:SulP family inorganic anion transporter [Oceanimonas sp. NS1]|nr:SulP family inorganic anion transporter [Oceanimonas sp. NS1]
MPGIWPDAFAQGCAGRDQRRHYRHSPGHGAGHCQWSGAQYGLYTAIVGGFVIALAGGSRLSISGPTAAFVVILYPIAQQHGLGGLLLATLMAGVLLVVMALLRVGRLVEYIPEPVILGFTAGIAVVIAGLQLKDFFGLTVDGLPEAFLPRLGALALHLPELHWPSLLVAGITLAIMLLWPRLNTGVPPHLPAVLLAGLAAAWLNQQGLAIDTISSRFSYLLPDGTQGRAFRRYCPPWFGPGNSRVPMVTPSG